MGRVYYGGGLRSNQGFLGYREENERGECVFVLIQGLELTSFRGVEDKSVK